MSFSKQEQEKLKGILRQAYQEKENLEIGDLWPDDLMHRLRGVRYNPIGPTVSNDVRAIRLATCSSYLFINTCINWGFTRARFGPGVRCGSATYERKRRNYLVTNARGLGGKND